VRYPDPVLTVLIATHNGADTIARTLAALAALRPVPEPWKLVVVNNASTDATESIVLSWEDRLPLAYLVEPKIGKNAAVNTGLSRVEGELVVFTDDDVLPYPDWLAEWRRVADAYPDYAMFGGAIEPAFEKPPPSWIDRAWMTLLFGATDPDRPEGAVHPNQVFGGNMAVRRSVFDAGVRFNEAIGPSAQGGIMGAETELLNRLAVGGMKSCFAPTVRVKHIVHKHQFTRRWVLRRFFRHGRGEFAIHRWRQGARDRRLFNAPRWIVRRFLGHLLRLPFAAVTFDQRRYMPRLCLAAFYLGQIHQARIMGSTQDRA
jgi:glycosyltransferase involved in cell wall biosynthesis